MGWWTDIATRHTQSPHVGGPMIEQRGVVIHIAQGSYEGTINWQMNPSAGVSSHFVVAKDGRTTQMVDTDVTAWTQAEGNGHWLSIENEGFVPDELTSAQLDANARILRKAAEVYGVPLQVAICPDDRGLGHHSMGAECGVYWGHSECPGANIKAQKPEVVNRAKGDDVSAKDVWTYDVDPSGGSYTAGGAAWTTLNRTDYLANNFAPTVLSKLDSLEASSAAQSSKTDRAVLLVLLVLLVLATSAEAVAAFVK